MGRLVQVLVAALICGVVADIFFVFPFALSSQLSRIWFASFGIGALFAAIGAGWVGTSLASDQTRSRLLLVVGVSEATAAVVAVIGYLLLQTPVFRSSILLPVLTFGLSMVVVALAGSWATLRFRSSGGSLALDLLITFGLVGLAVLVHIKTIILAPLP